MKSTLVTIATVSAIGYLVPATMEELCNIINPNDTEKAKAIALNAANQYYLQQNLIKIRSEIGKALTEAYKINPKLYVGKVEVKTVTDKDGVITGYASIDGKKKFKADEKIVKESAKNFIERVVSEKALDEKTIRAIVQKVADANGFSAEQKRVRGSVASKPVGAKWTKLATKIIAAGNGDNAAKKLSKELGETVDVSGEDAVKRLALALSNQAKKALAALAGEQDAYAGTDEAPLVIDGTKATAKA